MSNNEYLKYPTITSLSAADKEKYQSNHIKVADLLQRIESLEQCIQSMSEIEQRMVTVIDQLEQRIFFLENNQERSDFRPAPDSLGEEENLSIGQIVELGKYDNTDIEWIVVDKNEMNDTVLLVSRNVLFTKKYHNEKVECTWEKSDIRRYLNNEFYANCFSEEEKLEIAITTNYNTIEDENGGNDTQDCVFLLSISEINQYFKTDVERKALFLNKTIYSSYWLRSPGSSKVRASYVFDSGSILSFGSNVVFDLGVRPAVWIHY